MLRNKNAKMGNGVSNMSCGRNGGENSGENDSDRAPTQEAGERAVDGNKTLVQPKTKPLQTTDDDDVEKEKGNDENEKGNDENEKGNDEKDKGNQDDHGTNDEIGMHNDDESVSKKRSRNDVGSRSKENIVNASSKLKKRKPNNQLREERAPALLHNQMKDFFCHVRAFHHTFKDNTVVPYVLPLKHMEFMCVCGNHFELNKSVHAFRTHSSVCTAVHNFTFQENATPKFMMNNISKKWVLRIPGNAIVACLCGHVGCLEATNKHMKECLFVKTKIESVAGPRFSSRVSDENRVKPMLTRHSHSTNSIEKLDVGSMNLDSFCCLEKGKKQFSQPDDKIRRSDCFQNYKVHNTHNGHAKFYVPNNSSMKKTKKLKTIGRNIATLSNLFSSTFDELSNLKCCVEIQGHRIEIVLTDTAVDELKGFLNKHRHSKLSLDNVMNHCRDFTILEVGEDNHKQKWMGKMSLIVTRNTHDQNFHLDVLGSKMHQCVMLLSDKSMTTKVCQPKSEETIDSTERLAKILLKGAALHKTWLQLNLDLVNLMSKLPNNSTTKENLKLGLGELFKVSTNATSTSERCEEFDFETTCVCDAPAGTIVSLDGNVQHAGSGASKNDVRSVLFWSCGDTRYDSDSQHTKLTVAITLLKELWCHSNIRLELLKLLFYCFNTTDASYQETCPGCFQSYRGIPKLLASLNDCNKDDKESVFHVLNGFLEDDCIFAKPSQNDKRNKRAKERSMKRSQI